MSRMKMAELGVGSRICDMVPLGSHGMVSISSRKEIFQAI